MNIPLTLSFLRKTFTILFVACIATIGEASITQAAVEHEKAVVVNSLQLRAAEVVDHEGFPSEQGVEMLLTAFQHDPQLATAFAQEATISVDDARRRADRRKRDIMLIMTGIVMGGVAVWGASKLYKVITSANNVGFGGEEGGFEIFNRVWDVEDTFIKDDNQSAEQDPTFGNDTLQPDIFEQEKKEQDVPGQEQNVNNHNSDQKQETTKPSDSIKDENSLTVPKYEERPKNAQELLIAQSLIARRVSMAGEERRLDPTVKKYSAQSLPNNKVNEEVREKVDLGNIFNEIKKGVVLKKVIVPLEVPLQQKPPSEAEQVYAAMIEKARRLVQSPATDNEDIPYFEYSL